MITMDNTIVNINYEHTGLSTGTNPLGMREMQAKVYEAREKQYLLVKAPPASGKSRAMMFVALYKMAHQGIRKTIVAVPEKSIGGSFKNTELKKFGFFCDWTVAPYFNLCGGEGVSEGVSESRKVARFKEFLSHSTPATTLVCTHATLRYAFKELPDEEFNDTLVGIDEFHHTSADADSGLGDVVRRLMANTNAHILAMTGSYFRGDGIPVLRAEDEARFHPVTYNYYQQLNGYKYLKNLQIGYKFYQGRYTDVLPEVIDCTKKTIIHIPSVNARAATNLGKYGEVDAIIRAIGRVVSIDYNTTVITVETPDGRLLKVADLVEDTPEDRNAIQTYLRNIRHRDDMDIIIALGTAKEGFDWRWCERCLTIGVRGSLTEVVQIIGRCTRDCEGKERAEFVNLIAQPEASQDHVSVAVNDFLKAITASLLMEQVMAPAWNFKTAKEADEEGARDKRTLKVEGLKPLSSAKTRMIVAEQLDDLKANILQNTLIQHAMATDSYAETINQVLIPKVIRERYPSLTDEEVEEVRQRVLLDTVTKSCAEVVVKPDGDRFLKLSNRFINLDKLSINIIDSINPFQRAYEILSKKIDKNVLKIIQDTIAEQKYDMPIEEAILLCKGPLKEYMKESGGQLPDINNPDMKVQRLAQAYLIIKNKAIRRKQGLDWEEK
ncbi:MAG: DEAD/DEAH box helicase family protein [Bacteroidaceae bacterium]|nr:DEAD/DEAH box helicase family protein [Bacteroidaceae bacterium]